MFNNLLLISSATMLLGISSCMAFLGKPTEMGLAIMAGALGLAFANLDKFSKFKGGGFEAELRDKIEAVIEKETESDPDDEKNTVQYYNSEFNTEEQAVIHALSNPAFTWRTLSGISSESKVSESQAWSILVKLCELEMAATGNKNKSGKMIWSPTKKARNISILMHGDLNNA